MQITHNISHRTKTQATGGNQTCAKRNPTTLGPPPPFLSLHFPQPQSPPQTSTQQHAQRRTSKEPREGRPIKKRLDQISPRYKSTTRERGISSTHIQLRTSTSLNTDIFILQKTKPNFAYSPQPTLTPIFLFCLVLCFDVGKDLEKQDRSQGKKKGRQPKFCEEINAKTFPAEHRGKTRRHNSIPPSPSTRY